MQEFQIHLLTDIVLRQVRDAIVTTPHRHEDELHIGIRLDKLRPSTVIIFSPTIGTPRCPQPHHRDLRFIDFRYHLFLNHQPTRMLREERRSQ